MASQIILHQDASIVDRMIEGTLNTVVDINFIPFITFEKAIEKGLDPEKWENSAGAFGNKILIEGVPYKEYLNNRKI